MTSSHIQRWLTGIIAVPILVAVIAFSPGWLFAVVVAAVTVVAVLEFSHLVFGETGRIERGVLIALGPLAPLAAALGGPPAILAVAAMTLLGLFILYLFSLRNLPLDLNPLGRCVLGYVYLPVMLSHLVLLRTGPQAVAWVFFAIVLAFSGDIAAYYVGRTFGKKKLMPHISPAKTVEGLVGLAAGSVIGCLVYARFFLPEVSWAHIAVLALFAGVVGQLGDLFESLIKRASGAKDSGTILPGHGGILDRLDCLLFIFPIVYYYRTFILA